MRGFVLAALVVSSSGIAPGPPANPCFSAAPTSYVNLYQWITPTTGVVATGSNVTAWNDQSGGSHSYITASVSPAPQTGGTINGAAAVTFASGAYLQTGSGTPYNTFAQFTLFAVVKPSGFNGGGFDRVIEQSDINSYSLTTDSSNAHWQAIVNDADTGIGSVTGGVPTVGTPALLTMILSGTTVTLQVNGTSVNSGTVVVPHLTGSVPSSLASFGGAAGTFQVLGQYGDSAVFTDAKSASDLKCLNEYFGNKYGITVP